MPTRSKSTGKRFTNDAQASVDTSSGGKNSGKKDANTKDVAAPTVGNARGSLGANIRNLDWFVATFSNFAASLEPHVGHRFEVSDERLRRVFFDWIELFESVEVKDYARRNYWDCVDYIAGMGLTGLISHQPLTLHSDEFVRNQAEPAALVRMLGIKAKKVEEIPSIINFWAEGFVYVCFCLSCIKQLRQQKGLVNPVVNDSAFGALRFWWSFRENVLEDSTTVLYYLDQILGNNPEFSSSNSLISRVASRENTQRQVDRSAGDVVIPGPD